MTEHEPTVPREIVVELALKYRELALLKQQQNGTMAEMIRAALAKIREEHSSHWGHTQDRLAREKLKTEKALAFLHLEWLATQLENDSGALSPDIDLSHVPLIVNTP